MYHKSFALTFAAENSVLNSEMKDDPQGKNIVFGLDLFIASEWEKVIWVKLTVLTKLEAPKTLFIFEIA